MEAKPKEAASSQSAAKKFGKGFLKFLMYGGWILILILVVVVAVVIGNLTSG